MIFYKQSKQRIRISILIVLLCLVTPLFAQSESNSDLPQVTIGVVKDGDSWFFDTLGGLIETELRILGEDQFRIVFKRDPSFNANWDASRAEEVLRNAIEDPEVNLILAQGILVMAVASNPDFILPKPVSGAHLMDPDIVGMMISPEGKSKKNNLNLVVSSNTIINDINAFKRLVNFDTLHILVNKIYIERIEALQIYVRKLEEESGVNLVFILMGDNAEDVLVNLPYNVQAIYAFPPVQMRIQERDKIGEGLISRRIPSFAFFGEPAVEAGILGGQLPDVRQQLARRVALNMQQLILGASSNDLPAMLSVETRMFFNAKTAKLIGFDPPFDAVRDATILNPEYLEEGDSINLVSVIEQALETNFDYLIQQQNTEISREGQKIAFSPLLPQVNSSYVYLETDENRPGTAAGLIAQSRNLGGVTLQQLIFSDRVISNWRAFRELYQGSSYQEEAVRLDIIGSVAVAYVRYLSAKTVLRVARDNLKVTQSNLELARLRQRVGTSGPEDVFRFEAQEAGNQIEVAEGMASEQQARVAINQLLAVNLEKRWRPQDLNMDSPYFNDALNLVAPLLDSQKKLDVFRSFSIEYALENAPELQAINHSLRAQEITLKQAKRQFFLPTVAADFSYNRIIDEEFNNSSPSFFPRENINEDEWTFSVTANLPLFEGTGRWHEVQREIATLRQLEYSRDQVAQLVETRVQQAMFSFDGSYPTLTFSARAADRAAKNLRVVTDKYEQGAVNIIDLLDAQNEAFIQRQNAELAVYNLLEDFIQFFRTGRVTQTGPL